MASPSIHTYSPVRVHIHDSHPRPQLILFFKQAKPISRSSASDPCPWYHQIVLLSKSSRLRPPTLSQPLLRPPCCSARFSKLACPSCCPPTSSCSPSRASSSASTLIKPAHIPTRHGVAAFPEALLAAEAEFLITFLTLDIRTSSFSSSSS